MKPYRVMTVDEIKALPPQTLIRHWYAVTVNNKACYPNDKDFMAAYHHLIDTFIQSKCVEMARQVEMDVSGVVTYTTPEKIAELDEQMRQSPNGKIMCKIPFKFLAQ